MIIAIIIARGGSKRIPRKNIKDFAGRPLITYPINSAKKSGIFDRIIVSTDTDQIANIASQAGAEIPFIRPAELADDFTPTNPVVLHALSSLQKQGCSITHFCCFYPNPFIKSNTVKDGYELLRKKRVSSVVPVTTFSFPVFRAYKINDNGTIGFAFPENSFIRSQDLPETYHDVGQFYWCRTDKYLIAKTMVQPDTLPLIIPRHLSQDLDTLEDWYLAEKMYETFMKNEGKE